MSANGPLAHTLGWQTFGELRVISIGFYLFTYQEQFEEEEKMSDSLTLEKLQHAIRGTAAAFRSVTKLQPAGGEGSTIFPPTYEGGRYATVGLRVDSETKKADRVLLDSVQSQANRMELALLDAWEADQISLPVITVDFKGNQLEKVLRITSLEMPHRVADAIIRDSLMDGKPFRKSELGKRLDNVDGRNATALFEICPTALVFGMWDSTGPKGGLGAKFARAVVSEIIGIDAQIEKKTSSRIDPLQIQLSAGPLYKAAETHGIGWTLDPEKAATVSKTKKEPVKLGKDGRPSEANHGNVTPTIADGGVTIRHAVQTTVVSLPALRRLRFPLNGDAKSDGKIDAAARATLAALALCAGALTEEQGCDLRSRCQLVPTEPVMWELLDKPGEEPAKFNLSGNAAISLFNDALQAAKDAGLPWREKELVLTPSPQLIELVRRSQELASQAVGEE
ncbi:MAG TPA: type I-U CRISPR-associated RAMP protein Csb1/Cas7u [Acidobacteriota bacterium]|jgi:CRISPR-associated protein Csb1